MTGTAPGDGRPGLARRWLLAAVLVPLGLLLAGGFYVLSARRAEAKQLEQETEQLAVPVVTVVRPERAEGTLDVALPGTLQAFRDAPIYARTDGYLRRWTADLGSRVKAGALLAEIDAPELDQQIEQARADLRQVGATLELARVSAARYTGLLRDDAVSRQEVDERTSAVRQGEERLAAAESNVRRLQELASYKRVVAPFDGIVTRRNVDVGTLINAGNGGAARELFRLAQVDPIRVFVSVPEANAAAVAEGGKAFLELDAYPGEKFEARIIRNAHVIDPATRTLLTEVNVPNTNARLLPGSYARVHLLLPRPTDRLAVPVTAVLFRSEGPRVAVVDGRERIDLREVRIGRDFGKTLEILGGNLRPDDRVVAAPLDSLEQGQSVRVAPPPRPESDKAAGR